jgi:hypothetical protein
VGAERATPGIFAPHFSDRVRRKGLISLRPRIDCDISYEWGIDLSWDQLHPVEPLRKRIRSRFEESGIVTNASDVSILEDLPIYKIERILDLIVISGNAAEEYQLKLLTKSCPQSRTRAGTAMSTHVIIPSTNRRREINVLDAAFVSPALTHGEPSTMIRSFVSKKIGLPFMLPIPGKRRIGIDSTAIQLDRENARAVVSRYTISTNNAV